MSCKFRALIALVFSIAAIGCATPYQPDGLGGGYSDNRIDSDTVSVEFRGNGYTSKRKVEMYLLYRCAEVTRDARYDYFIALNPSTEGSQGSFSTPGSFSSVTSFARGAAFTRASYFPSQTINFTFYGATTLIRMGRGQKPAENVAAYNAREVIEYMGPQINGGSEEAQASDAPTTVAVSNSSERTVTQAVGSSNVPTVAAPVSNPNIPTSGRPVVNPNALTNERVPFEGW
jgi:hypothetical protein